MHDFLHIAGLFFGRPLLVTPEAAEIVSSFLMGRMGLELPDGQATWEPPEEEASRFSGGRPVFQDGAYRGYQMADNGVGVVTVMGKLVNRGAWMNSSSGLTSFEGLQAQLRNAAKDPAVRAIALDMETPGGTVQGTFETADLVRRISAEKPVVAIANGYAASAGYAIASAASRIVVPPSGEVGSIGVVMVHLDRSGQLTKAGVKPTLIFAGAHKVDGNPFAALPEDTRDRFQAGVNATYDTFVKTVAQGRKKMTEQAVRDTEARMFTGQEAVDAGLADAVSTFEEAITEVARQRSFHPITSTRMTMSELTTGAPAPDAVSRADHNAAVEAARAQGAKDATARIQAILGADEAKGRSKLANHLAFKSTMSADEAKGMLAEAALETQEAHGQAPGKQDAQSYRDRKDAAGGLLLGSGDAPQSPAASAGWGRAIASANRSIGAQ